MVGTSTSTAVNSLVGCHSEFSSLNLKWANLFYSAFCTCFVVLLSANIKSSLAMSIQKLNEPFLQILCKWLCDCTGAILSEFSIFNLKMASQLHSDENKNVISTVANGLKNVTSNDFQVDSCSLNITSLDNTVLTEDEEDPVTLASTKMASYPSQSSNSLKSSLNRSSTICTSPNPLKVQFYRTLRNGVWCFPLLLVILVPVVCLTP